ncbi:MAG: FixH family protein [Rhizobiaceae bacterium]|nr:MAG: FixH family protein [Rhizobiaceae bacterium]CAG1012006.1 hypothetical protein RHIZO_04165 [Rhizobiaceae bacterium]
MNRRTILVVLAAIAIVAAAAFIAFRMMMTPPEGLDLARSKASAKGLYAVAIAPEKEPLEQGPLHSWILTVKTPDGAPVEGATIAVGGGMPQHGHGLPTQPQATAYLGEGRYRIEGVRFNMSGWWEFTFDIRAAVGNDNVVFNLTL